MEPFQVRWGGAALLFGLLAPLLTMLAEQQNASKVQAARHACRIKKKAKDCG